MTPNVNAAWPILIHFFLETGESSEGDADETTNCTEINLIGRYHITSRLRIDVSNFPCVNQLVANQPNREIQPLADDDVCTTRLRRIAVFIVAMTLFLDLSLMTALGGYMCCKYIQVVMIIEAH